MSETTQGLMVPFGKPRSADYPILAALVEQEDSRVAYDNAWEMLRAADGRRKRADAHLRELRRKDWNTEARL